MVNLVYFTTFSSVSIVDIEQVNVKLTLAGSVPSEQAHVNVQNEQ